MRGDGACEMKSPWGVLHVYSPPLLLSPARPGGAFFARMSEIDRPAAATESVQTEIRRPRLLRLSPDMLREMAERTERTKELGNLGPAFTALAR